MLLEKCEMDVSAKELVSKKITFLSFWMTVAIVVFHCEFWDESNILTHHALFVFSDELRGALGTLAMCFFFTKTGFLLFNAVQGKTYKELIRGRTKSLLIPFLAWNVVYLAWRILRRGYFPVENFTKLIMKFTLDPFDRPLWYVFYIWVLTFFTPVLKKIYKNTGITIVVYVALLLHSQGFLREVHLIPFIDKSPYFWWMKKCVPCYFLGGWIGYNKPSIVWRNDWIKRNRFVIYVLLIGALAWLLLWEQYTWIVYQVLPLLMWASIDADWLKKELNPIVEVTFIIYALHVLLLNEVYEWGPIWEITDGVLTICAQVILVVLFIGASCILGMVLRQFPQLNLILTGGRTKQRRRKIIMNKALS